MSFAWRALPLYTIALTLGVAAPATANDAVLLPRLDVEPELRDEARATLRAILEGEGWSVYALAEEGESRLSPRLRACGAESACAFELRAVLGVDVAVGLSIRSVRGEAGLRRVEVLVADRRGARLRGVAEEDEAGLAFAIADAARAALAQLTRLERPTVFDAPAEPTPTEPATWLEPSVLNYVVGTLLLAGSVPMLGYGINSAVRDGECVREVIPGACSQRIVFGDGALLFAALGVALLGSGLVTLFAQPIRVIVEASPERAGLGLEGAF